MAKFICETCGKEFKNAQGLNMHRLRTHLGVIKTPGQIANAAGKTGPSYRTPLEKRKGPGNYDRTNRWTQEQIDLLLQIESQYKRGKFVRWTEAFADHLDWHEKLGYRTNLALAGKLAYVKKSTARQRRKAGNDSQSLTVIDPRPVARRRHQADFEPQQNGAQSGVMFCPECGCHIRMWNHVAEVVRSGPWKK